MQDIFKRDINYARISVTDRCNLSCVYCMPDKSKIEFLKKESLMTADEIYKIAKSLSNLGIKKIKLTGGEPLVRNDIIDIIKKINSVGDMKITLTTNAVLLDRYIDDLYKNNIRDINISMDSLNPQKYESITGFSLKKILSTIENLKKYEGMNIKINAVSFGLDKDEILDLARISKQNNIHLRFIEIMPIGLGMDFKVYSNDNILKILNEEFGKSSIYVRPLGNGPAVYHEFENFKGKIGFISAMSHCFCSSCNRIRITCDGKLKPCLNFDPTLDILTLIRQGLSEKEIELKIEDAIYNKPQQHNFSQNSVKNKDKRKMYQIGG